MRLASVPLYSKTISVTESLHYGRIVRPGDRGSSFIKALSAEVQSCRVHSWRMVVTGTYPGTDANVPILESGIS